MGPTLRMLKERRDQGLDPEDIVGIDGQLVSPSEGGQTIIVNGPVIQGDAYLPDRDVTALPSDAAE